jgi:hypothetical protein
MLTKADNTGLAPPYGLEVGVYTTAFGHHSHFSAWLSSLSNAAAACSIVVLLATDSRGSVAEP